MIKNVQEAVVLTSQWIAGRARLSGAKSLVLGISGGVDSAVVAGLCGLTGMETVGVIMPCHSSPSSITRAEEVVKDFKLRRQYIDLEAAHTSIAGQVQVDAEDLPASVDGKMVAGALRSCLRAPTLDYVAKAFGGIIVGTGNRDEDEVTRYYQKRGDGCVDISPIAKFHKSEVYQLASYLGVPNSVLIATPSADLWGPDSGQEDEKELGISYDEIEWAMTFAQRYSKIPLFVSGGVSSVHLYDAMTMSGKLGVRISDRQRDVLYSLCSLEEKSRHKANPNLPVFDARVELGLDLDPVVA